MHNHVVQSVEWSKCVHMQYIIKEEASGVSSFCGMLKKYLHL